MNIDGRPIDDDTRCTHYDSDLDIVAIRFKCCGRYFPCHRCHAESVDHPTERWPQDELDQHAVLCGGCHRELTIRAYLDAADRCPHCHAPFNPRCREHRHLYFEISSPRRVDESMSRPSR